MICRDRLAAENTEILLNAFKVHVVDNRTDGNVEDADFLHAYARHQLA